LDALPQPLATLLVRLAADLGTKDRLAPAVLGRVCTRFEHLRQVAVIVPAHVQNGMDHKINAVALAAERHRDRVDKERHVVGDDRPKFGAHQWARPRRCRSRTTCSRGQTPAAVGALAARARTARPAGHSALGATGLSPGTPSPGGAFAAVTRWTRFPADPCQN